MGLRLVAALTGALGLSACFAVESSGPAIWPGAAAQVIPPAPGRYCVAAFDIGAEGAAESVTLSDCVTVRIAGGRLEAAWDAAPSEWRGFAVTRLGRGAYLLQERAADGRYRLIVAMLRAEGAAILPAPEPFVASGAPDGVLARLRDQTGLRFDRALREPELGRFLFERSVYYVRADAPDGSAAAIRTLRAAIGRAMALE